MKSPRGTPKKAIEHLNQALRISPRDPQRGRMYFLLTIGSACAKRYANGVEYGLLGINETPGVPGLHAYLAINYVGLGDIEKAKHALQRARRLAPALLKGDWQADLCTAIQSSFAERRRFLRIAAGLEEPSAAEALR